VINDKLKQKYFLPPGTRRGSNLANLSRSFFELKLKSSAILIAIVLGIIISGIVVGSAAIMSEHMKLSAQARDGRIAYRAALSGIEDGLLEVKFARSKGDLDKIMGAGEEHILNSNSASQEVSRYSIRITQNQISSYPSQFGSNIGGINALFGNSCNIADNAVLEKFQKMQIDDPLDLDLSYLTDIADGVTKPSRIRIYFSRPYQSGNVCLSNKYFTAVSSKLLNISGQSEEQLLKEAVNTEVAKHYMDIAIPTSCSDAGSNCHLRINPQVVENSTDPATQRKAFSGGNNVAGKYVYYALVAFNSVNHSIPGQQTDIATKPGLIAITSIGSAGLAQRKLEAKIDSTTGSYLGLFDYGIFCGDKCTGRGFDEL